MGLATTVALIVIIEEDTLVGLTPRSMAGERLWPS
jgi:hypothetical protein